MRLLDDMGWDGEGWGHSVARLGSECLTSKDYENHLPLAYELLPDREWLIHICYLALKRHSINICGAKAERKLILS